MAYLSRCLLHVATGCALTGTITTATFAQSQTDGESPQGAVLHEVTVTAERYSSSVQTTPVAVTAIDAELLEQRQVTNVLDAAPQIPGIVIVPGVNSNTNARIVLRGAGQEQAGINFDQAVGVYIDEIYQPRISGAFFDFFDIAQLEVLRGPQGTLYGRNTSGGALKITSMRPSFDWRMKAEASVGNWNSWGGKLFASGPLIDDKLAFSISGVARERDGYLWGTNYGRRVGRVKNSAERLKFLYTPTDNLDIQVSLYAVQDYSESSVGVPLTVLPGVVNPNATGAGRNLTITENIGDMGEPSLNNRGGSINAAWTLSDAWRVNIISGYGNLSTFSDGGALLVMSAAQQQQYLSGQLPPAGTNEGFTRNEWFSQEVNATYATERMKGVVGVYYYDEEGMSRSRQLDSPTIDQDRFTEASAVFAQGTYTLGAGIGLTAGLRYTREEAEFTQFFRLQNNASQSDSTTFTAWTPKLGVNWQITDNWMTYASWTKGFKSGGFNPVPPNSNTGVPDRIGAPTPYGPEKVDSYEVGTKFTTEDRTLRLNVALFQANYDGMQLPVFFPGTTTSFTSNATGAKVRGIELEPAWQATDFLQLYGNMSFTSGKYTDDFICTDQFNRFIECSDRKLKALVPEQVMLGFSLTPTLPLPGEFVLTGSWNYHSHYFNNVANEGPLVQTDAAGLYNASLSWSDDSGRYRVALEGRNLADKHYVLNAIQLANATRPGVSGYPNPPRQITLRVGVDF